MPCASSVVGRGMTQEAAAAAAGVSPRVIRRVERTGTQGGAVSTLRAVFAPFDARVNLSVWWRGADLDRLLDADHASVVEGVVVLDGRRVWLTASEVTSRDTGSAARSTCSPSTRWGSPAPS